MNIRDAVPEDLPAIVAIYNASIPGRCATADTKPITVPSRRKWYDSHGPTRPLWVAQEGHSVIGYLSFRNFYGRPAYHITAELAVYVHSDHQRRGVGSRLLERAIATAPSLGLETLLAFIFSHNIASLALFERFAFTRLGHLPAVADLDGRRVDLSILGRTVARPAPAAM